MKIFGFLRSFRLRVFLILLLIAVLAAEVMRMGMLYNLYGRQLEQYAVQLGVELRICGDRMREADFFDGVSSEAVNSRLQQLSDQCEGRVLVVDSGFHIIADTWQTAVGRILIDRNVIEAWRGKKLVRRDEGADRIRMAWPVVGTRESEEGEQTLGVILLNASTDTMKHYAQEAERRSLLIGLLILISAIFLAALLGSLLVRPFERVARAMDDVVSFDQDLPVVSDYRETKQIVDAFHTLRGRLKVLDDSRQEFVSNVSHELKTPIASIKVLADSLNTQTDVPIELYKEFMQDISAEVDRENEIITDLLELVRMEQGGSALHVENVDVNTLLEQITKRLGPLARKSEVDLILDSKRSVSADMDPVKMTLAITNVIENGIKYNKRPGWVRIVLDADHQYMKLTISDSGTGIPEAEQAHIFERFYRVDKSHSKEIGGTGLGLAITRKTILLHRGSIDVKSVMGEGTTFTIQLPLVYIRDTGEKA
ncbi:MAG: HAMP domain-containing histidine kinase [Lachnospiraceae bacterium]|nr:HAMP domain-containing histidine kinase [Lachnospiraceae bacterium]